MTGKSASSAAKFSLTSMHRAVHPGREHHAVHFADKFRTLVILSISFCAALHGGDDKVAPRPEPVAAPVENPTTEPAGPVTWHKDLESALQDARERKAPILVRVGAEWCGWCRRLDREILKPEVQQALARFVLVELDADQDQEDVQRLNVGPIPALRVLDAGGSAVRSHDGYLAAKPLVGWLRRAADPLSADDAAAAIADLPELTPESLPQLIKLLGHRDPELREEASRRLTAKQGLSAAAVVTAFRQGNLATRLSALEILANWKAPVADLDPWDPNTLTEPRLLAELESWATTKSASHQKQNTNC